MKTHAGRTGWLVMTSLLTLLLVTSITSAGSPWKKLIPFKSVDANTAKSYWLTEDQGPWLIFATSFAGSGAEDEAHDLVLELRKRYKLKAYMHKRHFDFSEPVYGRGLNRYGGPRKMKYRNAVSFDEIAVLVGNYTASDAPGAEGDLQRIKTVKPNCLAIVGNNKKTTTQRFTILREMQRMVQKDPDKHKAGPMRRAFIARNPMLPKEFFVGAGLDPFVANMNKRVKHSLLDCPGKYTVRVAAFRGKSHFVGEEDAKDTKRSLLPGLPGRRKPSELEIAADKAHRLTEMLREKGIEAYEFHDRFESVVTIGSFASVGNKLPDGRIDLHPQIHQIMQSYGADRQPLPGQKTQGVRPRSLNGISFDIQPLPVKVPRRSIGADFAAGNR